MHLFVYPLLIRMFQYSVDYFWTDPAFTGSVISPGGWGRKAEWTWLIERRREIINLRFLGMFVLILQWWFDHVLNIICFVASTSFPVLMCQCRWIRRWWPKLLPACSSLSYFCSWQAPLYTRYDRFWTSALIKDGLFLRFVYALSYTLFNWGAASPELGFPFLRHQKPSEKTMQLSGANTVSAVQVQSACILKSITQLKINQV